MRSLIINELAKQLKYKPSEFTNLKDSDLLQMYSIHIFNIAQVTIFADLEQTERCYKYESF